MFPDTKKGYMQVQAILNNIEGIPGASKYISSNFPQQKSRVVENMKLF